MKLNFATIQWEDHSVVMLDQRVLPGQEIYQEYRDAAQVAQAIRDMVIRGAPAIGIAGAFGMALAAQNSRALAFEDFEGEMNRAAELLVSQRPTAVNLAWAVRRIQKLYQPRPDFPLLTLQNKILEEALEILAEDIDMCAAMGHHGAELIESGKTYLTHCNAGALATGGQGTALSLFYEAKAKGKTFRVFADETRPFLQGARLTCWELQKHDIDATLITDNMAAHFMQRGEIDGVVTGSDRIAANGDMANKIGTYGLAVLAEKHGIPFYVVAPGSTVDLATPDGWKIPIEERDPREVTSFFGQDCAPAGIAVKNPAFDVTPHELITAIVTERGILRPPFSESLKIHSFQSK